MIFLTLIKAEKWYSNKQPEFVLNIRHILSTTQFAASSLFAHLCWFCIISPACSWYAAALILQRQTATQWKCQKLQTKSGNVTEKHKNTAFRWKNDDRQKSGVLFPTEFSNHLFFRNTMPSILFHKSFRTAAISVVWVKRNYVRIYSFYMAFVSPHTLFWSICWQWKKPLHLMWKCERILFMSFIFRQLILYWRIVQMN